MSSESNITYPIPIYRVAHHFYVYDIEHVTHIRREHNIIGILIGSLPQAPQQNVFLGLPLKLLAEEARLLVEQGHAYVVDDVDAHHNGLGSLRGTDRAVFKRSLAEQGRDHQKAAAEQAKAKKELALSKLPEAKQQAARASLEDTEDAEARPFPITPTTSYPPFAKPQHLASTGTEGDTSLEEALPDVPSLASYALYRYLHSQSYFMSSGLRFGAPYSVYPGDPLRFHAHFLARGYDWDEDIDLLSIIGGGRLGTGVKKGFLIGGPVAAESSLPASENGHVQGEQNGDGVNGHSEAPKYSNARCFCIEWAGM